MHRNLQQEQTLTATHAIAAAWTGIGSAILRLWYQRMVRTSAVGVLYAFIYLANIMTLHVTSPTMFSAEPFNTTQTLVVEMQSLPAFDPDVNPHVRHKIPECARQKKMTAYASGSLYSLPVALQSDTNLGLHGGTLYDVLDNNAGTGKVTVGATGFNITCGYSNLQAGVTPITTDDGQPAIRYSFGFGGENSIFEVSSVGDDYDTTTFGWLSHSHNIFRHRTIEIVDSRMSSVFSINMTNFSVSNANLYLNISMLRCSQSLVNQTGVMDSQSHQLFPDSIQPSILKTAAVFAPANGNTLEAYTAGNMFLNSVCNRIIRLGTSHLSPDCSGQSGTTYSSIPTSELHLNTAGAPAVSIANLAASSPNLSVSPNSSEAAHPPLLLRGNAAATELVIKAHLDVAAGLETSIGLLVLSFPASLLGRGAKNDEDSEDAIAIDGTGPLHTIWPYRNHPELEILLEQVEHSNEDNMRDAGMVTTSLVGGQSKRRSFNAAHISIIIIYSTWSLFYL
ncbi:hypothetical protein DFH08DRAFT_987993 [Mycena albidolilacea]|uniref:Uncharacterized protein n=1 Tax=Mycena albidolilacea TaxID=1033008 RepID=A0AAD7AAN9_9AGAR|nr:hypothetical protein DFH08DRAFT_987993 [Mycena albidolilacea]